MDAVYFLGALLIAFLLFIGIPIAFSFFLFRYLKRSYPNKIYKYFGFLPVLFLIFMIWVSIFPLKGFYMDDFKEVTKLEFPKQSRFIYKTATFPDHFGDYTSIFLFETTSEDYRKIKTQLKAIGFEETKESHWQSSDFQQALKRTQSKVIFQYTYMVEGGKDYYVGFLDDSKSILVRRVSW